MLCTFQTIFTKHILLMCSVCSVLLLVLCVWSVLLLVCIGVCALCVLCCCLFVCACMSCVVCVFGVCSCCCIWKVSLRAFAIPKGNGGADTDFRDDDVYPGVITTHVCPVRWPSAGNEFIILGNVAKGTNVTLEVLGSMRIISSYFMHLRSSCLVVPLHGMCVLCKSYFVHLRSSGLVVPIHGMCVICKSYFVHLRLSCLVLPMHLSCHSMECLCSVSH